MTMRYVIADRSNGRPYVARAYASQAEADRELAGLLLPYPPDHEWRARLHVRQLWEVDECEVKPPGRPRLSPEVVVDRAEDDGVRAD